MAAPLDAKVSSILSQHNPTSDAPEDLDEDALLDALEREDDTAYRAQRLEQLHKEFTAAKGTLNSSVIGTSTASGTSTTTFYPTLRNDQALLDLTTENPRCIVHFSHPDFARCATMDEHLEKLAPLHYEVRFARADVRDCPFIVEKLSIKILPCVIGFIDGVSKERILGFEGLGGSGGRLDGINTIRTLELEERLLDSGILLRQKFSGSGSGNAGWQSDSDSEEERLQKLSRQKRGIRDRAPTKEHSDEDDWD
jgi:hypothetical protein